MPSSNVINNTIIETNSSQNINFVNNYMDSFFNSHSKPNQNFYQSLENNFNSFSNNHSNFHMMSTQTESLLNNNSLSKINQSLATIPVIYIYFCQRLLFNFNRTFLLYSKM